jgi:hypothetical protein
MSAKSRSRTTLDSMAHRHYQSPLVGDGVTVEFALPHSILRGDDLNVYVAGALMTPATPGVANDYKIRGITAGYAGDKNRIKFAVAPGMGVKIMLITAAG